MPTIGVVGIPDGWSSQKLVEAFTLLGCDTHLVDMKHVVLDLDGGKALCGDFDLCTFDALAIKKIGSTYAPDMLDRLAALRYVGGQGPLVCSRPERIKRALDRMSCTVTLRNGGIPMPPTTISEDADAIEHALARYHRAVLKPLYSTKARGMQVIEPGGDARAQIEAFRDAGNPMMYLQKMMDLPGKDLGLVFLGGVYQGCYARVAHGLSWNTTTHAGGRYESFEPTQDIVALAQRAQDLFGLDFTCVDVAQTGEGPVVFEVSAFGGFRGLWDAKGIDAAGLYARYVLEKLGHE